MVLRNSNPDLTHAKVVQSVTEESVPVMVRVSVTNLTDVAFQNVNVTLDSKVTNVNVPLKLLPVMMTMALNAVAKGNVSAVNASVTIRMNGLDYFAPFQIVPIVSVLHVKPFQHVSNVYTTPIAPIKMVQKHVQMFVIPNGL